METEIYHNRRNFRAFQPAESEESKEILSVNFDKTVDLEIGCGVGWHPVAYSQKNPERQLIAIEHTKNKFNLFYRRFESHGKPNNLLPVHNNAISWIPSNIPDNSISRIFLLYPNPWPKRKQFNQRWHRMPFMHCLQSKLKPGGSLMMATNIKDYAEEANIWLEKNWLMQRTTFREIPSDFKPRTHFEKKYLSRGETCFELVFKKSEITGSITYD